MEEVGAIIEELKTRQNDLGEMLRVISQIPPNLADSVQNELARLANTDWTMVRDIVAIRLEGRKAE